jgi:3-phosphoglycerate kinase
MQLVCYVYKVAVLKKLNMSFLCGGSTRTYIVKLNRAHIIKYISTGNSLSIEPKVWA